jgi:hypothetical protein
VREIAITREKYPSVRLLVAAEGEHKHRSLVDALPRPTIAAMKDITRRSDPTHIAVCHR